MSTIQTLNTAYGFTQALLNVFPQPIIAQRAPTTKDKAQLGTTWINESAGTAYVLTQILNNSANWQGVAGGEVLGSLTVTPGPISLTGTTTINTSGAANTTIGTGGTGTVFIGNATGNTAVTGTLSTSSTLTVSTGGLDIEAGGLTATGTTFINTTGAADTVIGTGGTGAVEIGNATGNTSITGTLTTSDGITATTGDITITAGNLVISTATDGITLPGPTRIINGAGAPASGLAVNVGDMYVNTTAATATTRLYIATAAGTWTNVTCAA